MADGKAGAAVLAKVGKLIEVAREREAELAAVLREIETLINGGEGIGALLKRAEAAFALAWSTRYPGAYVWQYQKDRPNMKRLIGSLGIDELEGRFGRYILNGDPFFTGRRHPFGTFVATVNQHAGAGTVPGGDLELEAFETEAAATQAHLRRVRGL